jgi:hypothetical protein
MYAMKSTSVIVLALLCFSCEQEKGGIYELPVCQAIVQSDMYQGNGPDMLSADPFEILGGEIIGDCLEIRVSFGGGCREHEFTLYYKDLPQMSEYSGSLLLVHDASGDLCEVLTRESLYFDLTGARDTARNMVRLMLRPNVADSDDYLLIDYYYQ